MDIKLRIEQLRDKINHLIESDAPKEQVYQASAELDELIREYYRQNPA